MFQRGRNIVFVIEIELRFPGSGKNYYVIFKKGNLFCENLKRKTGTALKIFACNSRDKLKRCILNMCATKRN